MKPFACGQCGSTVYFENVQCGQCGSALGFSPGQLRMLAFEAPAPAPAPWAVIGGGQALQPCGNRAGHGICNWMLDPGDTNALCRSCRLTLTFPNLLEDPQNLQRWQRFEQAKRRLLFTLIGLGLPPEPTTTGTGTGWGLRFQLLADQPGQPSVLTGHEDGLITLNLAEADDVQREAARVKLGEAQRTLLGHLRHETSHYLQQRHVDGRPGHERCRALFGDERADYADALARHYAEGAPPDWQQRFVSAYASAHPWEDWAETCAHYLLVVDAVQTASAWGLSLSGPAAAEPQALGDAAAVPVGELVLQQWLPVARFLNAMNRSLGLPDAYPYQLPEAVLAKMALVQTLLREAAEAEAGAPAAC